MNACEQSIRTEWGQALCPYDPASSAAWPLGESNMLFLTQVGLPRHATDGGNLAIEFLVPAQFRVNLLILLLVNLLTTSRTQR